MVAVPRTITERSEDWYVECDEPGCKAAVGAGRSTDREAIEAALALAVANGWQIASDRFIRSRLDLCPEHRREEPR